MDRQTDDRDGRTEQGRTDGTGTDKDGRTDGTGETAACLDFKHNQQIQKRSPTGPGPAKKESNKKSQNRDEKESGRPRASQNRIKKRIKKSKKSLARLSAKIDFGVILD